MALQGPKDNSRKHPARAATASTRRQAEGEARNARWRAMTPEEQWASLDERLGQDQGAQRQRAKIAARVLKESEEATAKQLAGGDQKKEKRR